MASKGSSTSKKAVRIIAPVVAVVLFLTIWQMACTFELVPTFMLPSPIEVLSSLVEDAALISDHALTTIVEALIGLICGIIFGFLVAVAMERFYVMDAALSPIVTISQTIPIVAIAPLLVLWFGYDMLPKILLVALTTFFPITVSLSSGFKSVGKDEIDLLRTMGASRFQIFRYAKLPMAAQSFFSGLRISATYAVVAAVVAEWLGGFQGLGVFMTRVRKSYDYEAMFAAIIVISLVSLLFMGVSKLLEKACMPWERRRKQD